MASQFQARSRVLSAVPIGLRIFAAKGSVLLQATSWEDIFPKAQGCPAALERFYYDAEPFAAEAII